MNTERYSKDPQKQKMWTWWHNDQEQYYKITIEFFKNNENDWGNNNPGIEILLYHKPVMNDLWYEFFSSWDNSFTEWQQRMDALVQVFGMSDGSGMNMEDKDFEWAHLQWQKVSDRPPTEEIDKEQDGQDDWVPNLNNLKYRMHEIYYEDGRWVLDHPHEKAFRSNLRNEIQQEAERLSLPIPNMNALVWVAEHPANAKNYKRNSPWILCANSLVYEADKDSTWSIEYYTNGWSLKYNSKERLIQDVEDVEVFMKEVSWDKMDLPEPKLSQLRKLQSDWVDHNNKPIWQCQWNTKHHELRCDNWVIANVNGGIELKSCTGLRIVANDPVEFFKKWPDTLTPRPDPLDVRWVYQEGENLESWWRYNKQLYSPCLDYKVTTDNEGYFLLTREYWGDLHDYDGSVVLRLPLDEFATHPWWIDHGIESPSFTDLSWVTNRSSVSKNKREWKRDGFGFVFDKHCIKYDSNGWTLFHHGEKIYDSYKNCAEFIGNFIWDELGLPWPKKRDLLELEQHRKNKQEDNWKRAGSSLTYKNWCIHYDGENGFEVFTVATSDTTETHRQFYFNDYDEGDFKFARTWADHNIPRPDWNELMKLKEWQDIDEKEQYEAL